MKIDFFLFELFEQLDNQGLADSGPHVFRVNAYDLDPTALVQAETVGHDFANDEADHLIPVQGHQIQAAVILLMLTSIGGLLGTDLVSGRPPSTGVPGWHRPNSQ